MITQVVPTTYTSFILSTDVIDNTETVVYTQTSVMVRLFPCMDSTSPYPLFSDRFDDNNSYSGMKLDYRPVLNNNFVP